MASSAPASSLPESVAGKLQDHRVTRSIRRAPRVFRDTTDFTAIDYGDVIVVDERFFLVTAYSKEGRFGVDEQIKPWVPKVEELLTGESYIVKLVFYETFNIQFGQFTIPCYRSPEKEARVLELVQGRAHFMQGESLLDDAGNLVRVVTPINGTRLDKVIQRSESSHRDYFFLELPAILDQFLHCLEAIGYLHEHGLRHGDIRRDHIFVDRHTGQYSWIDFDYDFHLPEKPFALDLYELGNILIYLCGRGDFPPREILADPRMGEKVLNSLVPADFSLLFKNRVVNLQKLFPYIPVSLNNILLHFSAATEVFYETVAELHTDLTLALADLRQAAAYAEEAADPAG
ncbi:MAG: hypothetical protein V2I32_00115 [Desulforhopalus sp.]|jgi:hypothetical protein|nr:hypothetical protein [Desulforhopalus sp.]